MLSKHHYAGIALLFDVRSRRQHTVAIGVSQVAVDIFAKHIEAALDEIKTVSP